MWALSGAPYVDGAASGSGAASARGFLGAGVLGFFTAGVLRFMGASLGTSATSSATTSSSSSRPRFFGTPRGMTSASLQHCERQLLITCLVVGSLQFNFKMKSQNLDIRRSSKVVCLQSQSEDQRTSRALAGKAPSG